jgi:hypothetical protein
MSKIHFIGGEKGGVGKSVVARLRAQYCIDRSLPFAAVDADASHGALLRFYGEYTRPVDLTRYESADEIFAHRQRRRPRRAFFPVPPSPLFSPSAPAPPPSPTPAAARSPALAGAPHRRRRPTVHDRDPLHLLLRSAAMIAEVAGERLVRNPNRPPEHPDQTALQMHHPPELTNAAMQLTGESVTAFSRVHSGLPVSLGLLRD